MGDETYKLQLTGAKRDDALRRFTEQITAWNLSMPPVEPLVVDFGLDAFERVGLIECWIANEVEVGYCGKYLFIFDGQSCPNHAHRLKHETFFIVKGRVRMTVDGRESVMNQGDLLIMPPGAEHTFAGLGNALILEVSTPCFVTDNYFADPKIAAWLKDNTA